MSSPSDARQMDPPDSKQTAESHKLLHLHWILSITQTTLPSPPHDRLAARIKTGFGFDIEPTVESHDARPRLFGFFFFFLEKQAFGYVSAIFRAAPKTVIYIDFNQQAHLQCFGLTHFIYCDNILQLAAKLLVSADSPYQFSNQNQGTTVMFCPLTATKSVTGLLKQLSENTTTYVQLNQQKLLAHLSFSRTIN